MDGRLLKRKPIKETFYYEGTPIYVYNPTPEQQKELIQILLEKLDLTNNSVDINIDDMDSILKLFTELTSVKFPEDKEEVKEIMDDPVDVLISINLSLQEILADLANRIIKHVTLINKFYKTMGLSTEDIAKILTNEDKLIVMQEQLQSEQENKVVEEEKVLKKTTKKPRKTKTQKVEDGEVNGLQ